MKKHIKVYFDYFKLTKDDVVLCEVDQRRATDIYLINNDCSDARKMIALCKHCYNLAKAKRLTTNELQQIHNKKIETHGFSNN